MSNLIVAATVVVIAWGALAFGAVYPWAFRPLLIACAVIGAAGVLAGRGRQIGGATRAALLALVAVLAAAGLQLIPLSPAVIGAVSPATDGFLRNYDLAYAAAGIDHPLSLAPRATSIGVAFLAAFMLFLFGLIRALSPLRARRLAAGVVGFGVLLALIGIVQKAVLGDHAWAGMKIYGFWSPQNLLSTPFGPYINKNHFAGWMLMALPLALGLAMAKVEQAARRSHVGWRQWLLWLSSPEGGRLQLSLLAAFLMAASLLLTKSRSGVACLVLMMAMMSLTTRRRLGSARAGWAAFGALAALFVLVFAAAGADLAARITNKIDAMELRKNIWTDSARIVRDFPVAGTGLNTFGTAMMTYQTSQSDQHFQEAHNDYLQVIVEGGLLLAIPAFAALLLMAHAIRRRFAAAQDDATGYWVRAGAAVGLATIGVQAIVEFSLQMPGNAALAVVLMAIALHECAPRRSRS